jgi:hypothetical protein
MSIMLGDFQPVNKWEPDLHGETCGCCEARREHPLFLVDQTTKRRYSNASKFVVGTECFLLAVSTPIVHSVLAIYTVAYRAIKMVANFFVEREGETKYNFRARLVDSGKDFLTVVSTPLSLVGLELAALYGCIRPYDGRKLYATIERAAYGSPVLAPCFQPSPPSHAPGEKIAF